MVFHSLRNFASQLTARSLPVVLLAFLTLSGCNQFDPSQWPQERITQEIKQAWDLSSIQLQPAEGGYTGTGKSADGQTFKITVKVDRATKSLSYHGDGDRGDILDNSVRAEMAR